MKNNKRLYYKICCLNKDAKWELSEFSLSVNVKEEEALLKTSNRLCASFDKGNIVLIIVLFIKDRVSKKKISKKDKDIEIVKDIIKDIDKDKDKEKEKEKEKEVKEIITKDQEENKEKYKPLFVSYEKFCDNLVNEEDKEEEKDIREMEVDSNIEIRGNNEVGEKEIVNNKDKNRSRKGIIIEPISTKKYWDGIDEVSLFEIIGFILKKIHRGSDIRNLELIPMDFIKV